MIKVKRVLASILSLAMLSSVAAFTTASAAPELLCNVAFNSYATYSQPEGINVSASNWFITEYARKDKGLFMSADTSGSKATLPAPGTENLVISFDLKSIDGAMPEGALSVMDASGNAAALINFISGQGAETPNGIPFAGFGKSKVTNYAVVYRSDRKDYDVYVNRTRKANGVKLDDNEVGAITSVELAFTGAEGQGVIIDNVNMYADKKYSTYSFPVDKYNPASEEEKDITPVKKVIDLSVTDTVFEDDSAYENMLKGYYAFHGISGCVYANGEKKLLLNAPYTTAEGEPMLPAKMLAEAFGVNVAVDGATVTFGEKSYTGEVKDGVAYISKTDIIDAMGMIAVDVPSTYNAKMTVLGTKEFVLPKEQTEIDKLNDYLLFYRPNPEQFKALYETSPVKGIHPRIQFTQADFDRMVELSKTDERMKGWAESIISFADVRLDAPMYKHELYDGVRLGKQRDLSKSIHALAIAWHLTKDQKYVDRAYEELATFASWPDWNPDHHLDVGEALAAYAVGYDWLYHAFTPEQRAVIEDGMYRNGMYDTWLAYTTTSSLMGTFAVMENNHGVIDNTGAVMAAIAMMDVYPEEAAYIGAKGLEGLGITIYKWAPQGFWYEGPHYWELTMQFTAKILDTLDTAFLTDMGMSNLEGISTAAEAELQSQTPNGIYNFADSGSGSYYVPEMLYLANKYNTKGVYEVTFAGLKDGKWSDNEDVALAMMWYDPAMVGGEAALPLDYEMTSIDTIMMRNTWNTDLPTAVGVHAGETHVTHSQLDGGSFIFEAEGVRWSVDMGSGDYNSKGFWDSKAGGERWVHYRNRAESHSTIFTNPTEKEDHIVDSYAPLDILVKKPKGAIATVGMTELLYDVKSANRGFAFCDNRQSLVIRDELVLNKQSDVYWTMITQAASCEIDNENQSMILTQGGKKLKLEWASTVPVEASFAPAEALPSSPVQTDGYQPQNYRRIFLKANTNGEYTITVKLTPLSVTVPSALADWDKPIAEWEIPDGEIPPTPSIDTITIGGEVVAAGNLSTVNKRVSEAEGTIAPVIEVTSDVYDVEIVQPETIYDIGQVILTDKNDATNKKIYAVVFDVVKKPIEFEGKTSIPVVDFKVSDIPQPMNAPINMFDGDFATRWSTDGEGHWVVLDLGEKQKLDEIHMSFMSGNVRQQLFVVMVSDDGENWTTVLDTKSCGTTEELEAFPLNGAEGKFVKVVFNKTTTGSWNSITELVLTRNN